MEAILAAVLAYIQDPIWRGVLVNLLGYVFRMKPELRSSLPVVTLALNIAMAVVAVAGEAAAASTKPALYSLAEMATVPNAATGLLELLLAQVIADGAYNWPRKLIAWVKARLGIK
jgi:hypothetical protein